MYLNNNLLASLHFGVYHNITSYPLIQEVTRMNVQRSAIPRILDIFQSYLVCELGGAHDFNDVESGPADIIAQHLKL